MKSVSVISLAISHQHKYDACSVHVCAHTYNIRAYGNKRNGYVVYYSSPEVPVQFHCTLAYKYLMDLLIICYHFDVYFLLVLRMHGINLEL